MSIKDRFKKVKIYFQVEERLEDKKSELTEIERQVNIKKAELEETETAISRKKEELSSLKTEVADLKDYINQKFKDEFQDCDYEVDITNCYIIELNGKKYITLRKHSKERSEWYTLATGSYNVETFIYYDVLNVNNNKYRYLTEYRYGHDDHNYFSPRIIGEKPEYEERLLEVYPDLCLFADNKVPNTYLKKIYYEINELGNKRLIKEHVE